MHQRRLSQQMDSAGSGRFISGYSEVDEKVFYLFTGIPALMIQDVMLYKGKRV